MTAREYYGSVLQLLTTSTVVTSQQIEFDEQDVYVAYLKGSIHLRSRRKITFPNLRDCCTILDERSPCFAWEYLGALVRCRCPVGIATRSF